MTRDEAIVEIKKALRKRSGVAWSVTGGTGTSWGWITIDVMPRDRKFNADGSAGGCHMSPGKRAALAHLLGLEDVHLQGVNIPGQTDYRQEYVARARGEKPTVKGVAQWD